MKHRLINIGQLFAASMAGIALSLALITSFTNAQATSSAEVIDLAITASAPDHVTPEADFVVNVAYSNLTGMPAAGARITATLPAGVDYITATDRWGEPMPPSVIAGNVLVWDIAPSGTLSCCQHILITERVIPGVAEGTALTTSVEIGASLIDLNPANNTDDAVSIVCAMAGSFKRVSAEEAMPGDVLTYSIVLNLAPQSGKAYQERMIHLTDTLPLSHQVRFLGWTSAITGSQDGQMLQWHGRVRAGEPVTLQYRLGILGVVTPGMHITNGVQLGWDDGQYRIGPVTTVVTMPNYAYMFGPNGGQWHHAYGLSLTVPPGALTDTARFEFKYQYLYSATQVITGPPGWMYAHRWFDLAAYRFGEGVHQFNRPITLTLAYSDTDVVGLRRETLRLWTRNGAGEPWAMLGEPIRHMSGTISFTTTHFTEFALFGRGAYTVWLPMIKR